MKLGSVTRSYTVGLRCRIAHHEPLVAFFLPVDRLNWTLPAGPSTCKLQRPIRRICARYPSVNLSLVTRRPTSYRCFRLSVCLTAWQTYYHGRAENIYGSLFLGDRNRPTYRPLGWIRSSSAANRFDIIRCRLCLLLQPDVQRNFKPFNYTNLFNPSLKRIRKSRKRIGNSTRQHRNSDEGWNESGAHAEMSPTSFEHGRSAMLLH